MTIQIVDDGLPGIPARWRELGRIRLGTKNQRGLPQKLESWRLTSPSQTLIEEAATIHGGTVEPWTRDGAKEWQVITETDTLQVLIPPAPASFRQSWELWTADGCQRDCDGTTDRRGNRACLCPPDIEDRRLAATNGNACKPITRLAVILRDLTGLGIWQMATTGYNAAAEFAAIAPLLRHAMRLSLMFPCALRLEQRSVKPPGKARQDFVVPVPDVPVKLGMMLDSLGVSSVGDTTLPPPPPTPALTTAAQPAARRLTAPTTTDEPPDDHEPAPGPAAARNALDAAKRLRQ